MHSNTRIARGVILASVGQAIGRFWKQLTFALHVETGTSLQSLNQPGIRSVPCGRGLAWSMISACQYSVQQNADDPGGRDLRGPGVQIPAAAPLKNSDGTPRRVSLSHSRDTCWHH